MTEGHAPDAADSFEETWERLKHRLPQGFNVFADTKTLCRMFFEAGVAYQPPPPGSAKWQQVDRWQDGEKIGTWFEVWNHHALQATVESQETAEAMVAQLNG